MIAFPLDDLLDEQACCDFLLKHLHPEGMRCAKGHALPANAFPHDRHRPPIFDYRCKTCGSVFNIFTRTQWRPFRGVHKKYLAQYVAVFEWAHNLKTATLEFVATLLGTACTVTS
jgi:transposase-like protein